MTSKKLLFLFLVFMIGTNTILYAKELKVIWQKAYGDKKKDIAYDSAIDKDGNIMIAGTTKSWGHGKYDMLITKLNKKGNPEYRFTYGGKQNDIAKAIVYTNDNNFVVAGYSDSYTKYGDKDVYVVKFNKNGKKLWAKSFGGDRDDEALDLVATANGGVIVVGYTESFGQGYRDGYILYLDKNGKEIWAKAIGGKDDDEIRAITFSKKGGFFVAGTTRSFNAKGFDFYIVKFDKKAKFQFKRVLGGEEDDEFNSIVATNDGGCAVAGMTKSFESKHSDIDIMRFSKDGKVLWHKIYGFKSKEWANSITTTQNGGFLIAGTTKSFGFGGYDFYLLELNSKGSSIWANVYGNDGDEVANSIKKIGKNNYLVVGKTDSYGLGSFDFMYIKLEKR
jgi:uncharacterized delta-60 repeat protein